MKQKILDFMHPDVSKKLMIMPSEYTSNEHYQWLLCAAFCGGISRLKKTCLTAEFHDSVLDASGKVLIKNGGGAHDEFEIVFSDTKDRAVFLLKFT